MLPRQVLHLLIEYPRFGNDIAVGGIDAQQIVHLFQGEDDAAMDRHRRPGGTGAATARGQRDLMFVAQTHDIPHLFVRTGEDHRIGQGVAFAVIVTVGPAVRGVGKHMFLADDGLELGQDIV